MLITRSTDEKCRTGSKGVEKRSCDLLLKFWDSLSMMRTVEARNLIFEMQIGHKGYTNEKMQIRSDHTCITRWHGSARVF